jgi:hypothetical protein
MSICPSMGPRLRGGGVGTADWREVALAGRHPSGESDDATAVRVGVDLLGPRRFDHHFIDSELVAPRACDGIAHQQIPFGQNPVLSVPPGAAGDPYARRGLIGSTDAAW